MPETGNYFDKYDNPPPGTQIPGNYFDKYGELEYTPAPPPPEDYEDPTWGDYGRMVAAGGIQLGGGVGWLATKFGIDAGATLQQAAYDKAGSIMEGLTDSAKNAMAVEFTSRDEGELWTDRKWRKAKLIAAQSLLGTAAGMGVGSVITRGLAVLGMTRAVTTAAGATIQAPSRTAGAIGYGLGEAGVSAPSVGAQIQGEIEGMTHEELMEQSPEYRATYASLDIADPEAKAERAKKILADAAANKGSALSMVTTFVLSAPLGAVVSGFAGKVPLASTRPRSIAVGGGGEAAQEFMQSGAEKMAENLAMRAADPNRPIMEGVLEESVGGMLAGTIMGTSFGIVSPLETPGSEEADALSRQLRENLTDEEADVLIDQENAPDLLSIQASGRPLGLLAQAEVEIAAAAKAEALREEELRSEGFVQREVERDTEIARQVQVAEYQQELQKGEAAEQIAPYEAPGTAPESTLPGQDIAPGQKYTVTELLNMAVSGTDTNVISDLGEIGGVIGGTIVTAKRLGGSRIEVEVDFDVTLPGAVSGVERRTMVVSEGIIAPQAIPSGTSLGEAITEAQEKKAEAEKVELETVGREVKADRLIRPKKPTTPRKTRMVNVERDSLLVQLAKGPPEEQLSRFAFKSEGIDPADMRLTGYGNKSAFSNHPLARTPDDLATLLKERNYPHPDGTTDEWTANSALAALADELTGGAVLRSKAATAVAAQEEDYQLETDVFEREKTRRAEFGPPKTYEITVDGVEARIVDRGNNEVDIVIDLETTSLDRKKGQTNADLVREVIKTQEEVKVSQETTRNPIAEAEARKEREYIRAESEESDRKTDVRRASIQLQRAVPGKLKTLIFSVEDIVNDVAAGETGVGVKVNLDNAINLLSSPTFEEDVQQSITDEAKARKAERWEIAERLKARSEIFATAHKALAVENDIQRAAKKAAIAIGQSNWQEALDQLMIARDLLGIEGEIPGFEDTVARDAQGKPLAGEPGAEPTYGQEALTQEDLDSIKQEAATSPENDLTPPTEAQKEAGNYPMAHRTIAGLPITIENPEGSTRRGFKMRDHYGYIKRTEDGDGEQTDVFINPKIPEDFDGNVWVIRQDKEGTTDFDEHKVMLGYVNQMDAVRAYKRNYEKGWKVGPVTQMSLPEFKTWLEGDTTKPVKTTKPSRAGRKFVRDKKGLRFSRRRAWSSLLTSAKAMIPGVNKGWVSEVVGEPTSPTENFLNWFKDSKVVDEDGKPLVVYHGTVDNIESFDSDVQGKNTGAPSAKEGFFFTDRVRTADSYSRGQSPNMGAALKRNDIMRKFELSRLEVYEELNEEQFDAPKVAAVREKLATGFSGPNVMPVYLSLQNPLIHDFKGKVYREESYRNLIDQAKQEGRDGVIFQNTFDAGEYSRIDAALRGRLKPETIYVAFEATQIKSAIGNQETFSSTDSRIRFSKRGQTDEVVSAPSATEEEFTLMEDLIELHGGTTVDQRSVEDIQLSDQDMQTDRLTTEINRINREFPYAKIQFMNFEDAPVKIREGVSKNKSVRAVTNIGTGRIYIFKDRLGLLFVGKLKHVRQLAMHEIFHKGLSVAMPVGEIQLLLSDFYTNMPAKYKARLAIIKSDYKLNLSKAEDRQVAAEEVLAWIAETDPQARVLQRFITAIRQFLVKHGIITQEEAWTDAEITALIAETRGALRHGKPISEVTLTEEVQVEETGEIFDVETNADVALRQHDKRTDIVNKLRACL